MARLTVHTFDSFRADATTVPVMRPPAEENGQPESDDLDALVFSDGQEQFRFLLDRDAWIGVARLLLSRLNAAERKKALKK